MSDTPADLKYAATHEWARLLGEDLVEVGITDYAQDELGDVVYVELPEPGMLVDAGEECAAIESVKAASDLYAPVSGEIAEINPLLTENPELVNEGCYDDGWMFRILASDPGELEDLLTDEGYRSEIGEQEHKDE